jgi:tRNA-specific 2-thiouridylase
MSGTAVVAMSGGVDSAVAAALLVREGHEVVGLFMRTGIHAEGIGDERRRSCCSVADALDARMVADKLGIAFHVLNFESEFDGLIEHFCGEYLRGRTPNPCIICNRDLKFGRLYQFAKALNAEVIATGHYARTRCSADGRYELLKGVDSTKDQSYVLFPLAQEVLARTRLPLGALTKREVREIAEELGLSVKDKLDSQEICFVPDDDYRTLLAARCAGRLPPPGNIIDTSGKWLARHRGIHAYTIGQRHGLGFAAGRPMYVVRLDLERNTVIVGTAGELESGTLRALGVNWLSVDEPARGARLRCDAKIRYTHKPAPSVIEYEGDGKARVVFEVPQRAVTPGQAVVFYDGDLLLGGGWIEAGVQA